MHRKEKSPTREKIPVSFDIFVAPSATVGILWKKCAWTMYVHICSIQSHQKIYFALE
jgi:hypothetical protein